MEKPEATSEQIAGSWVKDMYRADKKVQRPGYTRRSARCPTHKDDSDTRQRSTTQFCGEVEGGWVFFCGQEGNGHYFVATPPA